MSIEQEQFCDDVADVAMGRPTTDDVNQEHYSKPSIPVRVTDPVAVQELPTLDAQSRNVVILLTATAPVKILNEDPRRSGAQIIANGGAVFVGTDQESVRLKSCARWPVGIPLPIKARCAWYVMPDTADITVSVINEQWAE